MSSLPIVALAALAAFAGCGNGSSSSDDTPKPAPARAGKEAVADPAMCDKFVQAVSRLPTCGRMRDEVRETYRQHSLEVPSPRDVKPPALAKCQMLLHLLRIDVTLDCPSLASEIPNVPIPL